MYCVGVKDKEMGLDYLFCNGLVFTISDCIACMGLKLSVMKKVHELAGVLYSLSWLKRQKESELRLPTPRAQLGIQALHRQGSAQMQSPATSHMLPGDPGI